MNRDVPAPHWGELSLLVSGPTGFFGTSCLQMYVRVLAKALVYDYVLVYIVPLNKRDDMHQ